MRRSRAEWRKHVALWRASGLTAQEYAAKAELNPGTLKFWKYVLAKEGRSSLVGPKLRTGGGRTAGPEFPLIEVRGPSRSDDRFEVELANGLRVRVPTSFNADALRRLLTALEVPS